MATYCVDTNVLIDVLNTIIEDSKTEEINLSPKIFYKKLRSYLKAPGELVVTQAVMDEMERILNVNSSKHQDRLSQFSPLIKIVNGMINSKKLRKFSIPPDEQEKVRNLKPKLSNYVNKEGRKHNIYTDYRIAKECVSNGIGNIISRNEGDFDEVKEFDSSIKIRVIRPNDSLYESVITFSNTLAGNLLRMIYEIKNSC